MTKIISSKYKRCRQLGLSIWGSNKDAFHKRNYPPGMHGTKGNRKNTTYGEQLRAKLVINTLYNVSERQLRNNYRKAIKKRGDSGENLIELLESRLMTFVYRSKLAPTIYAARQLVGHGHIMVNGKRVNLPSYGLKVGDVVTVRDNSRQMQLIKNSVESYERAVPDYVSLDVDKLSAKYEYLPSLAVVPNNSVIKLHLVIEYYSS